MKVKNKPPLPAPVRVPLREVERELCRRLKLIQGREDSPILRACMSNLIIYCSGPEAADRVSHEIPAMVALHPARVLLLATEPGPGPGELTASARVQGHVSGERWVCSEEVTLHATGAAAVHLPSAVRSLLIGDLPTTLWWAVPEPPALAGDRLLDLIELSDQIIFDSLGWLEPARGVVSTAAWLNQMEQDPRLAKWRAVADLNWRRLKYWRRLVTQALDPATAPGVLETVREVWIEHGPHAVIQAWELASWLACRLGWKVREGHLEPNVELSWVFDAPQGPVQLHIKRLAEGPAEVRRLRIVSNPANGPAVLNLEVAEGDGRLSALPDEAGARPRTVTVPPQPLAELIGQQLSDRARDPVFRESLAVARVLAQSVLGGR